MQLYWTMQICKSSKAVKQKRFFQNSLKN